MARSSKSGSRVSRSSKSTAKSKSSTARIPNKFVDKGTRVVSKANITIKK